MLALVPIARSHQKTKSLVPKAKLYAAGALARESSSTRQLQLERLHHHKPPHCSLVLELDAPGDLGE